MDDIDHTDDEERRALERQWDPLYDQRAEMPTDEFDGVHYFVHEAGRSPAPPPQVLAYFDAGITPARLADHFAELVDDMVDLLERTTTIPMRPGSLGWAAGEAAERWWSDAALAELRGALRGGETTLVTATVDGPDQAEFWHLNCWCVPGDEPGDGAAALSMSLTPSPDLWPPDAADAVAEQVLSLVESWVPRLDVRTGAVTYDRGQPGRSPWDMWYGLHHHQTAPWTRDHVRGYFWANLLTGPHVARLGGLNALRAAAETRGFDVRVLDAAGVATPPAVIVRATGPVTDFDDKLLAAMKDLLAPVLIPARYNLYQGYPLRIVPDPGTAFRRVPVGDPFPRLLPPR